MGHNCSFKRPVVTRVTIYLSLGDGVHLRSYPNHRAMYLFISVAYPELFDTDPDPTFHADVDSAPEPNLFSLGENENFSLNLQLCFP